MAVAEVNALSGYKFDNDELDKLTGISDLQRVELENDDTKANIYFNPVGLCQHCLKLNVFRLATLQSAYPSSVI